MEFKDLFVSALVIGLFIFAIIFYSSSFSSENNAPVSITQNEFIGKMYGNISDELNQSTAKAESSKDALVQEGNNPVTTALGFVFTSIVNAGNLFMVMIINIFGSVFIFANEFLQINAMVTGVLLAIITGVLILAIWSVIRAGR